MVKILRYHSERQILLFCKGLELTCCAFRANLYRYTSERYLEKDSNGDYFLTAKTEPVDMVIDRYHGHYHVFIAYKIGPGLSFLTRREKEYQNQGRICVAVTLKDVIDQGGLVYPVSSLPAFIKAFFFTIPSGKVRVRIV